MRGVEDGRPADWELLVAWRDGDERSGSRLVRRYLPALTRFFHNKVRNPEDAAELITETMLACTKGRERVEAPEAFRPYLFAIAMNKLREHYRVMAKRQRELDDFEDICVGDRGERSLGSLIALRQETRLLVRGLRRIPLRYQIVLELNYFEGLGGPEIAELLGVPEPTVYTRLRRGRLRLQLEVERLAESADLAISTVRGLESWVGQIRAQIDQGAQVAMPKNSP